MEPIETAEHLPVDRENAVTQGGVSLLPFHVKYLTPFIWTRKGNNVNRAILSHGAFREAKFRAVCHARRP